MSFSLQVLIRQKIDELWDFAERHHGKWVTQWEVDFLDRMRSSSDFSAVAMKTVNDLHSRLRSKNLLSPSSSPSCKEPKI